jgi:hypothetical protein
MYIPFSVIVLGAIIWFAWQFYIPWRERRGQMRRMRRGLELIRPKWTQQEIRRYVDDLYS